MESQSAEQDLSVTKQQSQEAGLRDSLAKTAALSEVLANDKVKLNRILLQVHLNHGQWEGSLGADLSVLF